MIRKAKINEVPEIRRFLADFSRDGDHSPILGIASLHICWAGLGEIRSVAVWPTHQRQGIASRLVEACLDEARIIGLSEIFLLTLVPEFFQRFGFRVVSREDLLPIVWADCVHCIKFPDCDEVPMLLDLEPMEAGD
jgi:amino-acid N-acetyltransferase